MGGTNGEDHGESEQRAQDSSTGKATHDLRNTGLLTEIVLAQKLHPGQIWVVNMSRTKVRNINHITQS